MSSWGSYGYYSRDEYAEESDVEQEQEIQIENIAIVSRDEQPSCKKPKMMVVADQSSPLVHSEATAVHADGSISLSSILAEAEDVAVNIISFLPLTDCSSLHSVSSEWNQFLIDHEDHLFGIYLVNHFSEGEVLRYVARQRNISSKNIYKAFTKRWSLQKEGDGNGSVSIPWRGNSSFLFSNTDLSEVMDEATSSFVFIGRFGMSKKDPTSCALFEWNHEHDNEKRKSSRLCIDQSWKEATGGITAKEFSEEIIFERDEMIFDWANLTLHVLDVRFCSVATVLEERMVEYFPPKDAKRLEMDVYGFGDEMNSLYGKLPK